MSATREDVYEIVEKIQDVDSVEYLDLIAREINRRYLEIKTSVFFQEEA